LIDMDGKQVIELNNGIQSPGSYSTEIINEKNNLAPGVYLLKFMISDGIISRQIVKF